MLRHPDITRERLEKFAERDLRPLVYPQTAPVRLHVYAAPDRIPFSQAVKGKYRPTQVGEVFGPAWSTHWFRIEATVPKAWTGSEVHLLWDAGGEACVWMDGEPLQGLTGTEGASGRPIRPEFRLLRRARGGEQITLYIEFACNNSFGVGMSWSPMSGQGHLRQAEIALFDREAWTLLWDFKVIAEMAAELPADSPRAGQALATANRMVNITDVNDRSTWSLAHDEALIFFAANNGRKQHRISAIGHAHIDTAWLWPIAETRRKCIRTFASAVRYMEDYPEYRFACPQAQQLAWIREQVPTLYRRIRACVSRGQFIPVGGTWVEPDCNLPSGESLVRQFLYGQRFFQQEFGRRCNEFWNPDVFGYAAQLPQILCEAGIDFFLTQKLSWNEFNKIPAHTFLWEGIDGSCVMTHFPPTDTYNCMATVRELLYHVRNFKDHDRAQESCLLFGYGDGGGGPTPEMLERLRRMRDVEGLPRVDQRTPMDFFERIARDIQDPLVWRGELYFERHRGTYTTQAHTKRDNRRSELWLRDVEMLAAVCGALGRGTYPAEEVGRLWRMVLTNQFHDILPGSSIGEVYRDCARDYAEVLGSVARLREQALNDLFGPAPHKAAGVRAINTLSHARREVVALPQGIEGGQQSADGQALGIVAAPPCGWAVAVPERASDQPVTTRVTRNGLVLENAFVRATFQRNGCLVGLRDKRAAREIIPPKSQGNRFVLYDDSPLNWDAWDIEVYHTEKFELVGPATSFRLIESGPLRAMIEVEYKIGHGSRLRQRIALTALSPRLDFFCTADWSEKRRLLKVEFPVAVRAAQATYEIQFGCVERPTHVNTSWDMARFEVCGHRWADLSEPDYGVALLNDSKYGYAIHDDVIRLSLLRGTTWPDPTADEGHHEFAYALLPHSGTAAVADVAAEAHAFNVPLCVQPADGPSAETSWFHVAPGKLVLDTVKRAEDSPSLVLRLYEPYGRRGRVRLSSTLPVREARRSNLLEDDGPRLNWKNGGVNLNFRPFEIITLKLSL